MRHNGSGPVRTAPVTETVNSFAGPSAFSPALNRTTAWRAFGLNPPGNWNALPVSRTNDAVPSGLRTSTRPSGVRRTSGESGATNSHVSFVPPAALAFAVFVLVVPSHRSRGSGHTCNSTDG